MPRAKKTTEIPTEGTAVPAPAKKETKPRAKKSTALPGEGAAHPHEGKTISHPPEKKGDSEKGLKSPTHVLQAEVNIGTAGHVDHGKCIALDEPVLLNNDFSDGFVLLQKTMHSVEPRIVSKSERLFDIPNFRVFSLDPSFDLVSVPAKLFVQNYDGPMVAVATKDGKRIKASPEHPLLVHTGKELLWKKAKELHTGDYIGALKKIPASTIVKDPYPDWKEELGKTCWIVTREEALRLAEKTNRFIDFDGLSASEWNSIRILSKLSIAKLEHACKISPGQLAGAIKKDGLSGNFREKLVQFYSIHPPAIPGGVIINTKSKSKGFLEVNDAGITDDMLQFLALIIGEGHKMERGVRFTQDKNALLEQYLRICSTNFGQKPVFRGKFDYCLENKALAEFLHVRYGVIPGNSRKSGIPHWIFALPNDRLAVFLRSFFSAECNVNTKSNQISLCQANKQSIQLIGYALKKFGIAHSIHPILKHATNTIQKTKREYWQLLISGRTNLQSFNQHIGSDLTYKKDALERICAKKENGKRTDRMVPLAHELFSELIDALGMKKRTHPTLTVALKKQPWFFAYQDCRSKNAISEEKLEQTILQLRERLTNLKNARSLTPTFALLAEWSVSEQEIASQTGLSRKVIHQTILHGKKAPRNRRESISQAFNSILLARCGRATILLRQIETNSPATIEWCKIKTTEETSYNGPIIDLQVPGYHNFAAGTGALISHNTSITKALSGKWPDTHSEELKRGISIRLGYADATFYEYTGKDGAERYGATPEKDGVKGKLLRKVSFIDAPGHETLMTTMLSGATLLNGALLVIAANEPCPQPRTAEHLMALQIAGIQKLIVVQNKIDLVDRKRAIESHAEIVKFLADYGYTHAPIVPVSANFNTNMDLLIQLIEEIIPTPKHDTSLPLKMYISRSFDVNKPGTPIDQLKGGVLGGSILQGTLSPGQKVEVTPGFDGKPFLIEVQNLHIAEGELEHAHPGGLIAAGTQMDPGITSMDKFKGQILCAPHTLPAPTDRFFMEWHELPRLLDGKLPPPHLKELMVFTLGTNTMVGEVMSIKKNTLDILLKGRMTVEKGQKAAISRRDKAAWRLSGWGTIL